MSSSHPLRCFCRKLEHTISLFARDKLNRTHVFHSVHVVFGESTSSKQRQIKFSAVLRCCNNKQKLLFLNTNDLRGDSSKMLATPRN